MLGIRGEVQTGHGRLNVKRVSEVLIGHGGLNVRRLGEVLIGYEGLDVRHETRSRNKLRRTRCLAIVKS